MKFHNMPYKRITYEELESRYQKLLKELQEACDSLACFNILKQRYLLLKDMTPMELCYVRHDMDVNNSFYAAEQSYYDEISPKLSVLSNQFDKLLLTSPHRPYFEELLGHQALTVMENNLQGFDSRLIALSQEENLLLSQHNQLTSNATVLWNGTQIKRSLLEPETSSFDRNIRKKASLALSDSWQSQRETLETIYDHLVHNRDKQAKTLGMPNYVKLSYHRMNRIGYGTKEISNFCKQVKQYLVPVIVEMEKRRQKRLNLEHLYFYDNGIFFLNGNPKPLGNTADCLEATRKMYTLLSPETAEFISFLLENELYDVEIRDGKRGGGYMTFFEQYHSPFIFANFDGTSENAYIMCHEGGHAFQGYLKRKETIRERAWVTSEAAETHAMAMEFFTWPYMDLFFGDRADDYRTMHLENALKLIARECQQDEFQQIIYENPDMKPMERNMLWTSLSKEYFPNSDVTGNPNLEQGCGWQRIPHIFQWPFYAIDYALAQVCALEYHCWNQKDSESAWQSYLTFCYQTGSANFPQLIQNAGLKNPFAEETLFYLTNWLQTQLSL